MATTTLIAVPPQQAARPVSRRRRHAALHPSLLLYAAITLLTCVWVLSLPILPTQDGPLHLYYVNIFRQLLEHQNTLYTRTYTIRHLLPPYATYYYGLFALGHLVSLETADKLFVTGTILTFAIAGYWLLHVVAPGSRWAPFLLLPVLLNWPTMMGFVNFMLSVALACLALAFWCRGAARPGRLNRAAFVGVILLMMVTHPVPWIFTMGFAALETGIRLLRRRTLRSMRREPFLRADLVTLALGCLPFLYVLAYRSKTQIIVHRIFLHKQHAWVMLSEPGPLRRCYEQAFSLLHNHGIILFLGGGWSHVYRLSIAVLFWGPILVALWYVVTTRRELWLSHPWLIYALLLLVGIVIVPDSGAGGYFLTTRLQILDYICGVAAVATALERLPTLARWSAGFCVVTALLTLALAQHFMAPVARRIVMLRQVPTLQADQEPGLLMRPVGAIFPPHLNFDSYNWAPVHYFRWHNLLLYNTAWLGEPLIPVGPRPTAGGSVDLSFFNQAPQFGDRPLANDYAARQTLNRVGFILIQKDAVARWQNPLSKEAGGTTPGDFAVSWQCSDRPDRHWYLCQPHPPVQ